MIREPTYAVLTVRTVCFFDIKARQAYLVRERICRETSFVRRALHRRAFGVVGMDQVEEGPVWRGEERRVRKQEKLNSNKCTRQPTIGTHQRRAGGMLLPPTGSARASDQGMLPVLTTDKHTFRYQGSQAGLGRACARCVRRKTRESTANAGEAIRYLTRCILESPEATRRVYEPLEPLSPSFLFQVVSEDVLG